MHYFIDGYNLLFRTLRAGDGDDLANQRRQIIHDLSQKVEILNLDVTLVFDSQYQNSDSERTHYNHLEIQYTSQGETADEFILSALKRDAHPQKHTVITSDKPLAWLSRRHSAKSESVEEFTAWLNKRFKNKLRHSKEEKDAAIGANKDANKLKKPVVEQKPVKRMPTSKATVEECFNYYLENFENEFLEMKKKKAKSTNDDSSNKRPKKSKDNQIESSEKPMSDMDRWLSLFENKHR